MTVAVGGGGQGRHNGRLRRLPPLAYLTASTLLALLLPSGLVVPQTGPATLAEYAPVPGHAASDAPAPLADVGQATSAGLGAGGGTEGDSVDGGGVSDSATTTTAIAAPGVAGRKRGGTKRCVGDPPRQTEDTLSPPCVAFYDGPNFGSTAKGVTGDEVRVVFGSGYCSASSSSAQRVIVDYDKHPEGTADAPRYVAAFARYFEQRYQLWGRRVHAYWFNRGCKSDEASLRADMAALNEQVDPFAVVLVGNSQVLADEAARLGMVTILDGAPSAFMDARAPHVMSNRPDVEETAKHIASFTCAVLAGRPARYSTLDTNKVRRFALAYKRAADTSAQGERLIRQYIAEECGERSGQVSTASGDSQLDVARWRGEGVTTVMFVGNPNLLYMNHAESQGWHPEWFVVPEVENNAWARLVPQTEYRNAYGLFFSRRRAERLEDEEWYRAHNEGCPGCPVTPSAASAMYDLMVLFFRGLQAAGPRLTADAIDRGLHAIPPHAAPDPWTPAAYFGPGDHFFIRDAMVFRWDATAKAERSPQPGCHRLVEAGKRYRTEDWSRHPGDAIFDQGNAEARPCLGEGS